MCIPLVGVVILREGSMASVELVGGERVTVEATLHPDVAPRQHVLVDRGLVIEVIDAAEAEGLLQFYAELDDLWADEDARNVQ